MHNEYYNNLKKMSEQSEIIRRNYFNIQWGFENHLRWQIKLIGRLGSNGRTVYC